MARTVHHAAMWQQATAGKNVQHGCVHRNRSGRSFPRLGAWNLARSLGVARLLLRAFLIIIILLVLVMIVALQAHMSHVHRCTCRCMGCRQVPGCARAFLFTLFFYQFSQHRLPPIQIQKSRHFDTYATTHTTVDSSTTALQYTHEHTRHNKCSPPKTKKNKKNGNFHSIPSTVHSTQYNHDIVIYYLYDMYIHMHYLWGLHICIYIYIIY